MEAEVVEMKGAEVVEMKGAEVPEIKEPVKDLATE